MDARQLEHNRRSVLERIARAAASAGRAPEEVQLVAVTKTVAAPVAAALVRLGTRELGESRADELERKHAWFAEQGLSARWHFLGKLQRNKARRVVRLADEIHSVDSLALLASLARLADELDRRPALFLQVHLSGEDSKQGFPAAELEEALARARALGLPLRGLMTMAPLVAGPQAQVRARAVFAALARLAAGLPGEAFLDGRARLSMGMSGDFEVAIAEGADVVRVGGALFAQEPAGPVDRPSTASGRTPAGGDRRA